MYKILFGLVVSLLALPSSGLSQNDVGGKSTPVPLPLVFKKFILEDEATAFCIGSHKGADSALAACDAAGIMKVALSQAGRGKMFTVDLDLETRPGLMMADLNGDGLAEVLVSANSLRVFSITPAGLKLVWKSKETYGADPPPRLALADFDEDGDVDIALLNYKTREEGGGTKSLYVYRNQGRAKMNFGLSGSITLTDSSGFHSTSGIAVGDFFGDQRQELVIGNSNGWLWLLEVKDGTPEVTTHWKVKSGGAIGGGLATGSFDADPKKELLVGTNGGDIFVYKFSSDGQPEVTAGAHAGRLAYGVQAGDIDGDGRDEFLLARGLLGYAKMTIHDVVTEVWKLEGNKLTMVWKRRALGFPWHALMLQDIDRDGANDLVIYSPLGEGKLIEVIKPDLTK